MQIHKFTLKPDDTVNAQWVAHGVAIMGSKRKFSIWVSCSGALIAAEGFDWWHRASPVKRPPLMARVLASASPVKRSSHQWRALEKQAKRLQELETSKR